MIGEGMGGKWNGRGRWGKRWKVRDIDSLPCSGLG